MVDSSEVVQRQDAQEAITQACQTLLGSYGMAKAGLLFLDDWQNQKGIVRVNRQYVDYIKSAFLFVTKVAGIPATLSSVAASGILAKARGHLYRGGKKLWQYNKVVACNTK